MLLPIFKRGGIIGIRVAIVAEMRAGIKINKPIRIKRRHIGRATRRYNKRHLRHHLSAPP